MNTPYQSIYDEAISDRVLQKVGRSKFSSLGNVPAKSELDQAIIDTMIDDISTLRDEISVLLKNMRKEFKGLEKDSLKLRLKDSSYYKSFKQSLWATNISSSYSDNIADVKFPGKFGKTIDALQKKVLELNDLLYSRDYNAYLNKLPKNMEYSILWKSLNLDNSNTSMDKGLKKSIRLGITPANYGGFYRMHMTNPPPDAFKSSTRGIGIGKYLYLALIHHCGHGYTDGSSDDALKVWNHIVKKRTDIYSFMAQDEIGSEEVLAISIRVPKKDVLQILNKWIDSKGNFGSLQFEKSFFGWLKYRNETYKDLPIDLLDDGLYELFKKEIEALNLGVQQPVIQNDNKTIDGYEEAEKIVDISNLQSIDYSIDTRIPNERITYKKAKEIEKKLSTEKWRLPTIQELYTIRYTLSKKNDLKNFNLRTGYYWSSTLNRYDTPWYLDSSDGYANISNSINDAYVILVREKQSSDTKPSSTNSKLIIDRHEITLPSAYSKYDNTLPSEKEILENRKEIVQFFQDSNNRSLANEHGYIRFWTSEHRINEDEAKIFIYDVVDQIFEFNSMVIPDFDRVRYYTIRFKNKSSNTKPSNKLSKIIIEKTKIKYDEAKRKYGDTLLKESDLTEEIKDEIIEFFKNGNNRIFRFWLDEKSLIAPNSFKVGEYDPRDEDFNYFFNNREVQYDVIRFKNKTSNNSNTSQGFGKGNRATSNTRSTGGGKSANNYIIIDDKKTYIQHKIMYEDNIFNKESLGEDSSSHSSFNKLIANFVRQNKPILEDGKFIFWCESDNLPCIGKYYIKGNYTSYTTVSSNSGLIYNEYYTIVKNF